MTFNDLIPVSMGHGEDHGTERDQGTGVPLLNPQPFLGAFVQFRHPSDGHIARLKPWLKVYDKGYYHILRAQTQEGG
jgi:hypothetical protein